MTVFQPDPKARTFNYQAGDVGYVPVGNFHYVQNIGDEKVIFLEIFKSNPIVAVSTFTLTSFTEIQSQPYMPVKQS